MYYDFTHAMSLITLVLNIIGAVIFLAYVCWPFILAFLIGYLIVQLYRLLK